jgi:hypothetical protein
MGRARVYAARNGKLMKVVNFKYSLLAASIAVSTSASAALYQIVEIGDVSSLGLESYGMAVTPQAAADPLGCFNTACTEAETVLAGDTRTGTDGLPFRQEAPFGIDNHFHYLDYKDLESYCFNELGYNSCENWMSRQWNGINGAGGLWRERYAFYNGYTSNAKAFLDTTQIMQTPTSSYTPGGGTLTSNSNNAVVNALNVNGDVIGSTSSGYYQFGSNYGLAYRERGFVRQSDGTEIIFEPAQGASIVEKMGRTMAFDSFDFDDGSGVKTYAVGSASIYEFYHYDGDKEYFGDLTQCYSHSDPASIDACQNFAFAQQAYVWDITDGSSGVSVSGWNSGTDANVSEAAALASARGAAISTRTSYTNNPVLVGYNTWRDSNDMLMQAAVFYPQSGFSSVEANAWTSELISGAQVINSDNDYIYSNSVATDINQNLLVIGAAKLRGDRPENGAAANKMFVADASDGTPSATYFSGGIFFSGAGGTARAVNNFNEIVGEVDAETAREYEGKMRRHRGFIYPYNFTGTDTDRRAIFGNQAWWIDDLTNGGTYSDHNNQYRIVDAADINDAGVIAATAIKCGGGYSDTSHNAYCTAGDGIETVVAVKLIPINGADASSIQTRSVDVPTPERQGGGIGLSIIGLVGLLLFRRKY